MPISWKVSQNEAKLLFSENGLTLIELLIAIIIIGIIIAVAIPNLRRFNESALLKSETEKLVSTLRQAQANAQAGLQPDSACPSGQINNWIVHFTSSNTYSLATYCYDPITLISGPIQTKYQITLSSGLTYIYACGYGGGMTFKKQDITFPCFGDSVPNFSIVVTNQAIPSSKVININKGGSINVP